MTLYGKCCVTHHARAKASICSTIFSLVDLLSTRRIFYFKEEVWNICDSFVISSFRHCLSPPNALSNESRMENEPGL